MEHSCASKSQYRLPDHTKDSLISIFKPSNSHAKRYTPYNSPIPPPPTFSPTSAGLNVQILYVDEIRTFRDISPRVMQMLQLIKRKCQAALKVPVKQRTEQLEEIKTSTDMIQSRWDVVHGESGLCATLTEQLQVMGETRFSLDYGDYLAIKCCQLKALRICGGGEEGEDWIPLWTKHPEHDWKKINSILEEEDKVWKAWSEVQPDNLSGISFATRPKRPFVDEVKKAAELMQTSTDQIRFEIKAYATRNTICHSGVKELIDSCSWAELGHKLLRDLKMLDEQYFGRGDHHSMMIATIKTIRDEWFEVLKGDGGPGTLMIMTEEANRRTRKKLKRGSTNS